MSTHQEFTGRALGMMRFDIGQEWHGDDFFWNCHHCGKSFSPIEAILVATDRMGYMGHILVREFTVKEIITEGLCEHLQNEVSIWIYDNPDWLSIRKKLKEEDD